MFAGFKHQIQQIFYRYYENFFRNYEIIRRKFLILNMILIGFRTNKMDRVYINDKYLKCEKSLIQNWKKN